MHQTLTVEGDVSSEEICEICNEVLPQLNELVAPNVIWRSGPDGILQVCFLIVLSDLMRDHHDNYVR